MSNQKKGKENTPQGFFAYLSIAILFSTSGLVVRGMATTFTNYGQVAVRGATVVLIMGAVLLLKGVKPSLKGIAALPFAIYLIAQPTGNIAFAFSANMIKATSAIFYLYAGQLTLGFLLGSMILKERITYHNWIAFGLAGTGLLVFSYPITSSLANLGAWLGILCGTAEAIKLNALAKAQENSSLDTDIVTFYQFISATGGALLMVWLTKDAFMVAMPTWTMAGALTISAFMNVGITIASVYGTRHFETNLGNVIISTELAFAAILNAVILKEIPNNTEVIGGIILIGALAIVAIKPEASKAEK